MIRSWQKLLKWAVAISIVVIAAFGVWTLIDRTSAYQAACRAGLPNFSRPAAIDADDLDCAILARKGVYEGVFVTGFEAANFSSRDFPIVRNGQDRTDTRAWYNCPTSGCDERLDRQLAASPFVNCVRFDGPGAASIKVEGWVTITRGEFGHLGQYPRKFFASRVLSVASPRKGLFDEWEKHLKELGYCDG